MDKESINNVLAFLKDGLEKLGVRVNSLALFGSAMKGNIAPDSDIDVIVISSDFTDKDLFERVEMCYKASAATQRKFGVPMDIIYKSPQEYAEFGLFKSEFVV